MPRRYQEVDVFTTTPYMGNPVAVVLDADGLSTDEMRRFARWTNLSETTFVLPPTKPTADYRVRIFTPVMELPFAGHPTLGTCHAWLDCGHSSSDKARIVQECEAGLVPIQRTADGLAFAAPPLLRSGPVAEELLAHIASILNIERGEIVAAYVVLRANIVGDDLCRKLLQDHVKATIAPYKYPRVVNFVDALPKTLTGKIQRFRLRKQQ